MSLTAVIQHSHCLNRLLTLQLHRQETIPLLLLQKMSLEIQVTLVTEFYLNSRNV